MLRGAIIGLGNVAVHGHLPTWLNHPKAGIVAAADSVAARRTEFERLVPGGRWYESADELLTGEKLDFVDICTPPATHALLIRAALQRGLHVLCEKPLVCRALELAELVELVDKTGLVLYSVHNWPHAPILRQVEDLLRQHEIGEVRRCRWQTLRTQPAITGDGQGDNWRTNPVMAGGGILFDHGWHVFSILPRWFGASPLRISAQLETRQHTQYRLEDTATVRLQYPRATAEIFLTWAADKRLTWAELEGTKGTIRVEDGEVVLSSPAAGSERRWTFPALSAGSHHPEWFGGVVTEFLAAVRNTMSRGNLPEASLCVTLLELAQESNRQGCVWLPIPPAASSEKAAGLQRTPHAICDDQYDRASQPR